MFGQQNKPGFGTPGFGNQTGGGLFGSSNTSSPFGSSGGFGGTGGSLFGTQTPAASTGGMFGAQTPATGTVGMFGAQTPAAGTGGMFGAQTPAASTGGMFGTNTSQSTGGLFGSSNTGANFNFGGFGTQQPQQQQQQQQSTGIFGSGQASTGLFSTPNASASGFGVKTPATGFGGATQGSNLFGSTPAASANLFGATSTANTGGGLFGPTNTTQTVPAGTTVKFNPPMGQDTMMKGGQSTNISTRHQCITAMKEYENKSLEELRIEDYTANRKGPQVGSTSLFGASQPTQATGFSFGATQNKPTGFGTFGATATTSGGGSSLFGQSQTAQSGGGLFGSTANKPAFGSTTTTASTGFGGFGGGTSLFGQTIPNKGLFGQTAVSTQQGGGLFGGTQTATNSFGLAQPQQQTQQAGGLFAAKPLTFGQPAANTGLQFGQTAVSTQQGGGLFGGTQTATNSFGLGQPQQQTQQAGGLFAAKPLTFGQPAANTGLQFGQTNTFNTGGLFGNKPVGQTNTGFSFVQTATAPGFGTQNKPLLGAATTPFGGQMSGIAPNNQMSIGLNNSIMGQSLAPQLAPDTDILQLRSLINSPYGESPLFRNLQNDNISKEDLLKPTNPMAHKAALASNSQYKVSPRPTARIKPKPIHPLINNKTQLFDGLEDEESSFGNDTFVPRRGIKKLIIRGSDTMSNVSFSRNSSQLDTTDLDDSQAQQPSPAVNNTVNAVRSEESVSFKAPNPTRDDQRSSSLPPRPGQGQEMSKGLFKNVNESFLNDTISDFNPRGRLDVSHAESTGESDSQESDSPVPSHPALICLRRHGYYTVPSLDELAAMVDINGDCIVDDFVVGREGFGNVMFPGKTNISNMNLDEIVHFRRKEITIYPDDDLKPPEGSGLNKKAQVSLDCVWPSDKSTRNYIKDPARLQELHYQDKLERATAKIGAKFLDYRPETGTWVFEVKHFSKYGLLDDSDDEEDSKLDPKKLALIRQQQQQQLAIQKQQIKVIPGQKPQGQDEVNGQLQQTVSAQPMRIEDEPQPCPLMSDEEYEDGLMDESFPKDDEMDDLDTPEVAPSSHRLANRLGVLAEELQLRKASFFGEEDEEFAPKWKGFTQSRDAVVQSALISHAPVMDDNMEPRWSTGKSLLSTSFSNNTKRQISPLKKLQTAFPIGEAFSMTHKSITKPMEQVFITTSMATKPRPVVGHRMKRKIPVLAKSLFAGRQHLIMDSALVQSQRFRAGWSADFSVVHAGPAIMKDTVVKEPEPPKFVLLQHKGSTERSRLGTDAQQLVLEKLFVSATEHSKQHVDKLEQAIEDHLAVQLEYTELSLESGCPHAVPRPGNHIIPALAKSAALARESLSGVVDQELYRQAGLVWELCHALWGDLENVGDTKTDSYPHMIARQEAVSEWLKKAVASTVHQEIEQVRADSGGEAAVIFQHLTGHQLLAACDVAQDHGDHQVSLLVSQAAGSETTRNYVQKQLAVWQQSGMDEFMDHERLKIYMLMGGVLVWDTSKGDTVNVCEDLDWKRAFAMHMWYHCPPTCSIPEAMSDYYKSFHDQSHASPPLPHYLEVAMDTDDKQDVCYHLLRLFCDRSHPLHKLLCPTSATPNYLDFRLSWQLCQVLLALDYTHVSEHHVTMLCSSYAAQLENMKLWHWAIFVLIHIPNQQQRQHAVHDVLLRHVNLKPSPDDKEREIFLQKALKIPSRWIHQAKAILAGYRGLKEEQAWHWLRAGHWNKAHNLILSHLASEAIVNENFVDLKCLLGELGSADVSRSIEDWDKGGRVFLDYITMMETLEQLQQSEPSPYELEKLQTEVSQLSKRIKGLVCRTATDRLCQSEMAKRAANLMRTLLQMKLDKDDITELLVTETIDLPLPEDYGLQELHQLTRGYMLGVAMS